MPFMLPDNKDSFSWSVPFIAEKVTQMFAQLLNVTDKESHMELTKEEEQDFERIIKSGELNKYLLPKDIEEPMSAGLEHRLKRRASVVEEQLKNLKKID